MATIGELTQFLIPRAALERDGDVRPGRTVDEGAFHRVRKGRFVRASIWQRLYPEDRHRLEVAAAAQDLADGEAVFSHESAAVIWGLPLYRHVPDRVHVTAPEGHRGTSSAVVLRHRLELPPEDIAEVHGLRVTSLERTAFDVARTLPTTAALSCLDAAMAIACVREHDMDPDEAESWRKGLRDRAAAAPGGRGIRRARALIEFADGRAQLPGESVSRLFLHRLGFAPPRLQVRLSGPNGGWIWVDLGLDDVGWWGEFDGKGKYVDEAQRSGRSMEQVIYDEKRREDWIRARTSRGVARWRSEDIRSLDAFAARLRAFGIRPPTAVGSRPVILL
ncbi:type IV toxin-antitoxin system AbiEi family antitoxin domain-containing protein [Microbacterium album]|uniref:Transcriptional regulator, AbiEi antitoxin, Type IV TA system n=1 Tax=Microbacterium album TaxID=2053191 RepID=A0A917MKR9_9MICO|nr:hypothetical protein [Microbacterium album]GGH37939.1 hypothetical protein GCM10010921_08210 [Microbacterium album]